MQYLFIKFIGEISFILLYIYAMNNYAFVCIFIHA